MRSKFDFSLHLILITLIFLTITLSLTAAEKFYNFYDSGLEFMKKNDWQRAIVEFQSATSLEFEDSSRKRTYGTRFIKYFPHREMGIAYYNLQKLDLAKKELQLSLAYKKSKQAKYYLDMLSSSSEPYSKDYATTAPLPLTESKPDVKLLQNETDIKKESENILITKDYIPVSAKKVPEGALTYDPSKVTQVGSRLSIAIMPFTANEKGDKFHKTVTDIMITQLVNLRRFRVIERSDIEAVMKEHSFNLSGLVDEDSALEVGKIVGADVIIMGHLSIENSFSRVSARVIDIETSENIVAKEASSSSSNIKSIEKLVASVAIMIYNDLPLVEGSIISLEDDLIYLDIGSNTGVKKGTKCVIFREGKVIKHPTTHEVLGKKVFKMGELIVVQVQEKMSSARIISQEGNLEVGYKVVVK